MAEIVGLEPEGHLDGAVVGVAEAEGVSARGIEKQAGGRGCRERGERQGDGRYNSANSKGMIHGVADWATAEISCNNNIHTRWSGSVDAGYSSLFVSGQQRFGCDGRVFPLPGENPPRICTAGAWGGAERNGSVVLVKTCRRAL